jgi:hypothetical protein
MTEYKVSDFEKATHSKIVAENVEIKIVDEILGDKKPHILKFDIYDGFAICPNYKGKTYTMKFPKVEFMKIATNIADNAREILKLDAHAPLQVEHVLAAYGSMSILE